MSFYQRMTGLQVWGLFCVVAFACSFSLPRAQGQEASAADLAARLGALVEDGDSATRLRLKVVPEGSGEKVLLQIQIKARRSAGKKEVLYQVLWPKTRKGQAFLIQKQGEGSPKGVVYTPPVKTATTLGKGEMMNGLLGSDLAYQDVIENFFRWQTQSLAGKEKLGRVECVIVESKPGAKDASPYGRVKSWIDPVKLVAMRVEKYDSAGKLVRRFDTTRVAKDDEKHYVPASLEVRRTGSGTVTEIEGSSIRHDVKFSDKDFTTSALNDFRIPR
ncbi:MAG: outer membrane lipoprotein-sorting protein [Verrucomicrobiota bacterium]